MKIMAGQKQLNTTSKDNRPEKGRVGILVKHFAGENTVAVHGVCREGV